MTFKWGVIETYGKNKNYHKRTKKEDLGMADLHVGSGHIHGVDHHRQSICQRENRFFSNEEIVSVKAEIVKITDVISDSQALGDGVSMETKDILFEAKILNGDQKGKLVQAVQKINSYFMVPTNEAKVGDKIVLVGVADEMYQVNWLYSQYLRTDKLIILSAVFGVLLILFGQKKGLQTLISLTFTVLAVFLVFIPAVLSGYNIYLWTLLTSVYVTVMTLIIVSGLNKKTVAAIIGCISGVIFSALLVLFMSKALKLTGVIDEESVFLLMINPDHPIDLKGIFFGAIVLGALGAIMDVSMSISSSLYEMKEKYAANSFSQLFTSGMTIGRDIMGTMANTLILAYIGSSLSSVLLMIVNRPSVLYLMNVELVTIELLQAVIGSLGILMTLPLTAFVSALIYSEKKDSKRLMKRV